MQTPPYWIGIGDIHESVDTISSIPGLAEATGVIVSGDLTTHGGADAARRVLQALRALNPTVFAQVGNMDTAEVDRLLEDEGVNIHARAVELVDTDQGTVGLIGVGASTPTPFNTPNEVPENQIEAWLRRAWDGDPRTWHQLLLVAHDPPHGTAADMAGGNHVGSTSVRAFIEEARPAVCLTGHIHESRAQEDLGPTRVINPGPASQGGYAYIFLHENRLKAELRTV